MFKPVNFAGREAQPVNARRSYFVMIALLCYAILFSQAAHAAKLPRRASLRELPEAVKLLVAPPVHDQDSATLADGVPVQIDGWPAFLLFGGWFVGFALRGFLLRQFAAAQRLLQSSLERLATGSPFQLMPLRV